MATKNKVLITIETFGSGVKVIIDTEKRGEMVRNLKRIAERLALVGSTDLQ